MQRGRGGRDNFFGGYGDPFASFGNFGHPRSLMSSFFGGRDPFDDPFFTQPFGNMMGPSMFGPRMFSRSLFDSVSNAGFLEQQAPQSTISRGPIIKELSSDGEEEEGEESKDKDETKERKDNPRKHSRSSKEPYVLDPDEEMEEKKSKHMQYRNDYSRGSRACPQPQAYTFHSSTVTYGGPNGAYYTSSTTRRAGGDGVIMEESKEADTTTGKATHRISRGIHERGHSVARRLNSDGRVDLTQTLHNLNEDELAGFEEAWKGSARQHLPGWNKGFDMLDDGSLGASSSMRQNEQPSSSRGWALPSAEQPQNISSGPHAWVNSFNGRAK